MAGTRGTLPRRPVAIRSPWLLRLIGAGMTLLTFGSMTYFAAGHVYEPNAPLQPTAPNAAVSTRAPAAQVPFSGDDSAGDDGSGDDGRGFFVSPSVPTTNLVPITRTRQSGG